MRDSSAYYLLGYNSTKDDADGKFHEIKVRDPAARRAGAGPQGLLGADAPRTRPGRDRAGEAVGAAGGDRALGSIEQTHRARFIRSWIGTSRGENGKTRVTFVWEPLPPVPGQDRNLVTGVSLIATGRATGRISGARARRPHPRRQTLRQSARAVPAAARRGRDRAGSASRAA